jgi:hypothetical protein
VGYCKLKSYDEKQQFVKYSIYESGTSFEAAGSNNIYFYFSRAADEIYNTWDNRINSYILYNSDGPSFCFLTMGIMWDNIKYFSSLLVSYSLDHIIIFRKDGNRLFRIIYYHF